MENIQEQIARNNETGQVGAVVGQNPDGTPKMADAKTAKLSDLYNRYIILEPLFLLFSVLFLLLTYNLFLLFYLSDINLSYFLNHLLSKS